MRKWIIFMLLAFFALNAQTACSRLTFVLQKHYFYFAEPHKTAKFA